MHDSALIVPFVLSAENHRISDGQPFDSWSQIDVMTDQNGVPRGQEDNESLMTRAVQIVSQHLAHHLLRESLASLEEKLDSEQFARVHRSAIVNMDRVKEMRPLFKGSHALVLEDGTQLKLSRQRRAELEERLSQSS